VVKNGHDHFCVMCICLSMQVPHKMDHFFYEMSRNRDRTVSLIAPLALFSCSFRLDRYILFVSTEVEMIKGFTNVFAGGEGLFMTTLTGPGVVWLQGQPPQRMISEIARRVPSGGLGLPIPIGVGGGSGSGSGGEEGGAAETQ
jgi:Mitochondrial biogenesis AIM24